MSHPATSFGNVLKSFATPADIVDFPNDPAKQQQMNQLWNTNVEGWVTYAQVRDIWDRENYGPRPAFYNPLGTSTPADATVAPIEWNAFPGRLATLFPTDADKWNEWADNGDIPDMTQDLCSSSTIPATPYTPTGPRGWQDEYCEWSVRRDPVTNEILSVMFTCENPEYWLTLWQVDPQAVLKQYQTLVSPSVTLDDLSVHDASGVVIDPATGQPVYNPLNNWNTGTKSLPASGGAMHLTSSPNTLGAEFDLAAAATIPRVDANGKLIQQAQPLICCAQYGRAGRHSDPTIGQAVNVVINDGSGTAKMATLTNPPGLYMQTPDWSQFSSSVIPNAQQFAESCWKVERGSLKDPSNPSDIDRILHATFTIPAGTKASDLVVGNQPLQFASQITSTITMKLSATVIATTGAPQTGVTCTADNPNPAPVVSAIQSLNVLQAYRLLEQTQNELPFSVPVLAYALAAGTTQTNVGIALNVNLPSSLAGVQVTVDGQGVSVAVTGQAEAAGGVAVLVASLTADASATPGPRGITATIPGLPSIAQPVQGLLVVTGAAATLTSGARPKSSVRRGRS